MIKLNNLVKKLGTVDIYKLLDEVMLDNKDIMISMQSTQHDAHIDSTGGPITHQASGYAGPSYDMYDTGAFRSGFNMITTSDFYAITSSDSKTLMLLDTYGDILGLTPDNQEIYIKYIQKELIIKFKKYLGL